MKRVLWLACAGLVAVYPLSAQEPKLRETLNGHTELVCSVAFSLDGNKLASGNIDTTITLWDVVTWKIAILNGHKQWITSVAYSPDGKTLASGSADKMIKLWDVKPGKEADK